MTSAIAGAPRVAVRGEEIVLLAERAALLVRERTLLVADAHFGKAAAFRAGGIPVPGGTTASALLRLDAALGRASPRRIVFLGDFLHAREGRAPATLGAIARWRARHAGVAMTLVRGNHDRGAGDPPAELGIDCVDAPLAAAPFLLAHHPASSPDGYVLAGHLHPGALLSGPGRQRERLPCFWFGRGGAVLPAFGDFTGLAIVAPSPGDAVYVVAGDRVLPGAG